MINANYLLSAVAGSTSVDSAYLVEDSTFCRLLKQYARELTAPDAIQRLCAYVNENY